MSEVEIRVEGACGRLTLNRPSALNSLTLMMVRELKAALRQWIEDPAVEFILLDGAGERGLCAGGDIRALYDAARSGRLEEAATFFREEYELNSLISSYPKPYIALMDGVVMGGGIGISAHGSLRVVTERSTLAMPETRIGFIPDVGGTFLLARAPDELGTYAALTASRLGPADALLLRLGDLFISSNEIPSMIAELALCRTALDAHELLLNKSAAPSPGSLEAERQWIRRCFSRQTIEEILNSLDEETSDIAQRAAAEIRKNSPTALKVTLRALRDARHKADLGYSLRQEYNLAMACLQNPDFLEGVRAALIDKDQQPRWSPDDPARVTGEQVEKFFQNHEFPPLNLGHTYSQRGVSGDNRRNLSRGNYG
ncbi:enoyl-CoA hydratase/isomerase family protein [Terriglobus albidus]|uniref:3-hydroxyisobutyryl-CoA hydrolase n=1 Tax=Terriglobus albidus TaxID=1592106 RepID=A0A5B9E791_9BACT|nr:enoyl-CoA hydratase/isomerase family protein [Terriglobus albidus]QEE27928.1 enoyl-CoA hydratase/isomerase family protein [Terriglobus albidus]